MNDDTTKPPIEGSGHPTDVRADQEPYDTSADSLGRVGFCQDCGRPLTQQTIRTVGTGVFCEPCLTARVGGSQTFQGQPTASTQTAIPLAAPAAEPSPFLAGILGFIPGVGAMYNGQFAKGIVHLIIFVVLVSLSENVNDIFGLFVAGWLFYMAFEAYHTAAARRDGLPLPNAFGLNDIGERMGFGKTGAPVGSVRPDSGATTAWTPYVPTSAATSAPQPPPPPVNQVPVGTAPDWVGYIPPTAFGANAAFTQPQPTSGTGQAQATASANASYTQTFTGAVPPYSRATPPSVLGPNVPPVRRVPTAAFWLIGLGTLILIANMLPDWKLTEPWWPPIFFTGLAVWLFVRRLGSGTRLVCIVRWPVILMVLAVMLALHAAYVPVTIALTTSVLLIVFGALLLLERTVGAGSYDASPVNQFSSTTVEPPSVEAPPHRVTWEESGVNDASSHTNDPRAGE